MSTRLTSFLHRPSVHLGLLLLIGLQAFASNISLSLYAETEGLYAIVTHYMLEAGDYIHLTFHGDRYFNKPPLFFWLQAGFINSLGWSEMAARLPSVLASLGTMVTTYFFGCLLFSPVAGFWAALMLATCYAGLWFGPLAIIDPVLTFFMTLGMYGWARAYFRESSEGWLVVGCIALALGTMVKTLHAFAMPCVIVGLFFWMRKDWRMLSSKGFWVGIGVFALMVAGYYAILGKEFWQHFLFEENLHRLVAVTGDQKKSAWDAFVGKRPIQWYFYTIWFDTFPWSLLLPLGLVLIWKERPLPKHPAILLVVLWVAGYFLMFSAVPEKHERYLLPLLPGVALLVGYVYHVFHREASLQTGSLFLKVLLILLGVTYVIGVLGGPLLLQKKWNVSTDVFPLYFQAGVIIVGVLFMVCGFLNRPRMGLWSIGVTGILLLITVTSYIVPGIHAQGSPRMVLQETQRWLSSPKDPVLVFQGWEWRLDEDQFYWDHLYGNSGIIGKGLGNTEALQALKIRLRQTPDLVVLMTAKQYDNLIRPDPEIDGHVVFQFFRSRRMINLVSLKKQA